MWCPGEPVRSSSHVWKTMRSAEDCLWRSLSLCRVFIAKNKMCSYGFGFLGSKGQIITISFVWKGTYFSSKYTADFYILNYILKPGDPRLVPQCLLLRISYLSALINCILLLQYLDTWLGIKTFLFIYHKFTKYLLHVLCQAWARLWR